MFLRITGLLPKKINSTPMGTPVFGSAGGLRFTLGDESSDWRYLRVEPIIPETGSADSVHRNVGLKISRLAPWVDTDTLGLDSVLFSGDVKLLKQFTVPVARMYFNLLLHSAGNNYIKIKKTTAQKYFFHFWPMAAGTAVVTSSVNFTT